MKKYRNKILSLLIGSFFLSFPSIENEAFAFSFTAPSNALVKISCDFLAKRFEPTPKEKKFIELAKIL